MKRPATLSMLSVLILSVLPAGAADKADFKRPLSIPFDKVTPYSPQLATLGKMLFFDPRLSGNENMNCATCHNPSFGWEAPVKQVMGAQNTALPRQAPTIMNAAWVAPNFWDGRAANLEAQAQGPISASAEMNGKFEVILEKVKSVPDYDAWFRQVFPKDGVTKDNLLTAIATYERTVVSDWSPFDRWVDGDENAISPAAKHGFQVFTGKAECSGCHSGWNFTDNKFHDIGLESKDIGRAKLEPDNPKAMFAFKTPSLRNILYRAPYMHDGSMDTLQEVIAHYESGGIDRPSLSPLIRPLGLNDKDREDLIAFLQTLTADKQDVPLPTLPN